MKTLCANRSVSLVIFAALAAFAAPAPASAWSQFSSDAVHSAATAQQTTSVAAAESVPRLVQFNGTLKDSAARPVAGVASVTFAIYADQDGGSALWSETQNVIADANGHFSTLLGGATANGMPAELFGTGQSRWLGITIARQQEMPRVLLASVPYALKAQDAETLGGIPASEYVTTKSLAAANTRATSPIVAGGATTIIATPQAASTATALNATSQATTDATSNAIPQVTPTGSGTTDYIPIWTSSSVLGNSLLFQTGGKMGLGTTTPAATFDINGGEILRGGFYEYPEDTATASNGGRPSHSFQWLASAYNSSSKTAVDYAFGFKAVQLGNNTSSPSAKLDLFYGTGGPTGTISDTGLSVGATGVITFVPSQTFSGATTTVNELNLPTTTSPTLGVITIGGSAFLGNYGDPSDTFVGGAAGGGFKTVSQGGMSGGNITAVGSNALFANTTGYQNTALGSRALTSNTSGIQNTSVGFNALNGNTTGQANTALGAFAGDDFQSGTGNTFLGMFANTLTANISNATAIGYNALVSASNSLVLGGNGSDAVNVGIGTPAPRTNLEILSENPSTFALPATTITLSTQEIGATTEAEAALDFNTYAFETNYTTYNPTSRIVAVNDGTYSNEIEFLANKPGAPADGLLPTMTLDSHGNLHVIGSLYVDGEASITGNLSKGGGTFKIDDPIDPANKYLSHSFVESPDMMNIYNGNVVTDGEGAAIVQMPDYFEALNTDFRYQLTVVGQFAQAIVGQEMQDGKFTIRTDKPHVKVSWMVTGIRHDAWANAHRTPVEQDKPAAEQGRYLHPELFGAPADARVVTAPAPIAAKPAAAQK